MKQGKSRERNKKAAAGQQGQVTLPGQHVLEPILETAPKSFKEFVENPPRGAPRRIRLQRTELQTFGRRPARV